MQTILVTGGAGYISAPCILTLAQNQYHIIVLDHKPAIEFPLFHLIAGKQVTYIQADYADVAVLKSLCVQYHIIACIHFAAYIEVGESVKMPHQYYENNVSKTITLLNILLEKGIKKFIFSSSCAVYGTPQWLPLTEQHPRHPLSPYGRNKMMIEMILEDYAQAYDFRYACLRYFNAAGALPKFYLGERHDPEMHLIPRALHAVYTKTPFTVFGNDYQTPDGTCVRDYLHIADLASAHYAALAYLLQHSRSLTCNLGTGIGYSVKQILATIEQVTGYAIQHTYVPRRAGDADILIADPRLAREILGWYPQYSDLENIIKTAHEFHFRFNEPFEQYESIVQRQR